MKFGWHPKIDKWIPESYDGNTERITQPYEYSPPISDYAGSQSYAPNEGEEMKIKITGFGDMTIKQIKEKIVEILNDLVTAAESDEVADVQKIEHNLFGAPELQNLVKEYSKHIKLLKSRETR
ncbi:MAG: hypothetical protein EBU90_02525 [Proteobacteria bacterium]|nr:hypothetical protein [Pseudomonadota bacterium]NBP13111.1 hypothetical protein [bacterium]